MESGTILQNNYNTDGDEAVAVGRTIQPGLAAVSRQKGIPMCQPLLEQMQEIPQLSGSFYSMWHWLEVGRTALEYKPSHTCRRSYVTNCLDKGMKLALVSKNVGHKNKSTTLRLMGGSEQTLKHSENP